MEIRNVNAAVLLTFVLPACAATKMETIRQPHAVKKAVEPKDARKPLAMSLPQATTMARHAYETPEEKAIVYSGVQLALRWLEGRALSLLPGSSDRDHHLVKAIAAAGVLDKIGNCPTSKLYLARSKHLRQEPASEILDILLTALKQQDERLTCPGGNDFLEPEFKRRWRQLMIATRKRF